MLTRERAAFTLLAATPRRYAALFDALLVTFDLSAETRALFAAVRSATLCLTAARRDCAAMIR